MSASISDATWTVDKPLEKYNQLEVSDDAQRPRQAYVLNGLKQNTFYEIQVIALNDIGPSTPNNPPFLFRTATGMSLV